MPTKLRFEVQGKSPLVYLTFYNDDFEKNLAKENADDFDRIDFQLANEVDGKWEWAEDIEEKINEMV
tara:strand:+ start:4472 stop:4672 length:201 start_codon:yes stop_codon:yes gene_type:complete